MKVLKFGGTSVSTSKSVHNICEILKLQEEEVIVVFSAISGVTNLLKEAAEMASVGNGKYMDILADIERKHIELCKELLSHNDTIEVLSVIKQLK